MYLDVYYTDNGVTIEDNVITLQKCEVFTKFAYYIGGRPEVDFTVTSIADRESRSLVALACVCHI